MKKIVTYARYLALFILIDGIICNICYVAVENNDTVLWIDCTFNFGQTVFADIVATMDSSIDALNIVRSKLPTSCRWQ